MDRKLKIIEGNIFTSSMQVMVNTINCVGVMGAGLALECKLRYPEMFEKYIRFCDLGMLQIGSLWLYRTDRKWILNFPTKQHWKYPSKEEYLHKGLEKFVNTYESKGIESIAFPLLGADKGGIDPNRSLEIMQTYLNGLPIPIEIYKYKRDAPDDLSIAFKAWVSSNDVSELVKASGVTKHRINLLKDYIAETEVWQLNQLANVKGVGLTTLERLFKVAQSSLEELQGEAYTGHTTSH
jgi:O-acetyl-ADP-ribose deacetylase (regulator of RNase III)